MSPSTAAPTARPSASGWAQRCPPTTRKCSGSPSFAHGFVVLSDVAEFCYKCTDVYDPTAEGGIPYDDPTVNVQWPDCGCEHKTSAKDKEHTPFAAQKFEYFEKY